MTRVVDSVDSVDEAAAAIGNGLVVALATDTVYGLVVDATQKDAVGILARLKGRPGDVPVQVLVAGMEQALAIGDFSPDALRVAFAVWPGAATLVVPVRPGVELQLGGDGSTVGIRWPAHALAAELCARCGPLAATSANRHGEAALETAAEVAESFSGQVALVVDGGRCPGRASTVVDLTGDRPRVLRVGAVSEEVLLEAFSNPSD
ncbi:MAG: L-threonylcarbamoyladenylate synthase [Acidimicrobiales bacterium]